MWYLLNVSLDCYQTRVIGCQTVVWKCGSIQIGSVESAEASESVKPDRKTTSHFSVSDWSLQKKLLRSRHLKKTRLQKCFDLSC